MSHPRLPGVFQLLLAAALIAVPRGAAAQAPLRVEGDRAESFASARGRQGAFYPATALGVLGASVQAVAAGVRIVLFGDTLSFEARSPFFRDGKRTVQLLEPAFVDGGTFFIPEQFFIEWLPARFPQRVSYRGGALHLAPVVAAEAIPQPRRDSVASPAPPARRDTAGASTPPRRDPPVIPPAAATPRERPAAARRDDANRADRQRVVILNAGHGGRDPGKTGPTGLREKDVALQMAQRLSALLRDRGYEVHLTRTRDTLIALGDRPKLANQWKGGRPAALYISIHANSGVAQARGFETYFLSDARTEDERRVAEMENAAVAYEEKGRTVAPEFDHILNGLRNDFYIKASNDLAEVVQKRMAAFHPGPNRGVKQAGFRVLVGAFMPAVLVEVAFISNNDEARLLGSSAFQQKVTFGIADAVDQFFTSHEHLWVAE